MRVLIVDDSLTIRAMVEQILSKIQGVEIIGPACDADEAALLIQKCRPDVITLDIAMPGMDGLAFLQHLMANDPRPVIMVSSMTQAGSAACEEALRLGATHCFSKSKIVSDSAEFCKIVAQAYAMRNEVRRQRYLH
jgi:two-component system chemotaxis response regulator CheB